MWGSVIMLFLRGNWQRIVGGLVVVVILGVTYAAIYHRGAASRQHEIDSAEAKAEAAEARFAAAAAKWNAERKAWDEIVADANRQLERARALDADRAAADVEASRVALADANRRVSDARAALGIALNSLKSAHSAPAECRSYEADPSLLPQRDLDVLIRLGQSADDVVRRLQRCVQQYDEVTQTFSKGIK